MRKRTRKRPEPFTMRRVLGESSKKLRKQSGSINLNLSEVLDSLPMTIAQDEIQIEARIENGHLSVIVYCNETVQPGESLAGGEYEIEEP